ncbi:MAG: hypothetical protein ACLFWD_03245 [Anaerolineales bacterium]
MQEDDRSEFESEEQAVDERPPEEDIPAAEASSESRTSRWARTALRWAAGLGLFFALGVLVVFFVRVRPQSDQIRSLQRQLDERNDEVARLGDRVEGLEPLEQENEELRAELKAREQQLELLSVLVDLTTAQLDLLQDQPEAAASALEDTDALLESLAEGLEAENAERIQSMRNRLELVLEGLDDDTFAAQRDLEIMANNLVDLEQRMFGEN